MLQLIIVIIHFTLLPQIVQIQWNEGLCKIDDIYCWSYLLSKKYPYDKKVIINIMFKQICLLWPCWLQHSQNHMIWLSFWNASPRHRSLFTVLIKWKPWNEWGNSGILSCECVWVTECESANVWALGLGNVICTCNDVFDTLKAWFKLSLNGGGNSILEIHIIWGFLLPLYLICPEDSVVGRAERWPRGEVLLPKGRVEEGHGCLDWW